jgi:hypothetical protein
MEGGSIIIIALTAALVITYYQSASTKAVAAQCDNLFEPAKPKLPSP